MTCKLKFLPTDVKDCTVVVMDRHYDNRGYFQELYEQDKYQYGGVLDQVEQHWKQVNCSVSKKNVLRGIHVAEYAKLVTCVHGKVWDVVVDLRSDSPTYLKYAYTELCPDNITQMYVPPGCGHGFVSLEDDSVVVYLQTALWKDKGELTVMYNEPVLNIPWPGENHIISEKDMHGSPMWVHQMCVEKEMNFPQNDEMQAVWVASLPPEDRAEWLRKFPEQGA